MNPALIAGALALGGKLLGSLFGGDDKYEVPKPPSTPPYTSPYLSPMDEILYRSLSGMVNSFLSSGWGMPPELRKWFPKSTLDRLNEIVGNTPGWSPGFIGPYIPKGGNPWLPGRIGQMLPPIFNPPKERMIYTPGKIRRTRRA